MSLSPTVWSFNNNNNSICIKLQKWSAVFPFGHHLLLQRGERCLSSIYLQHQFIMSILPLSFLEEAQGSTCLGHSLLTWMFTRLNSGSSWNCSFTYIINIYTVVISASFIWENANARPRRIPSPTSCLCSVTLCMSMIQELTILAHWNQRLRGGGGGLAPVDLVS